MAAALASANAFEDSALATNAIEFLARASSTSEVLTLNLTNLLILLVLKALIFGFGIFSVGGGTARSSDEVSITETEVNGGLCFLMYASGVENKLGCIKKAACYDVKKADEYQTAAKMMYNVHKYLGLSELAPTYTNVINGLSEATTHAKNGGDCSIYDW